MAKKLSGWKTRGMNRDLSVSAFNPEFAFENINLRLATNDNNTTLSWVNEKGTSSLNTINGEGNAVYLNGVCIGTAILNNYLVLFMTKKSAENPDYIYRLKYSDSKTSMEVTELFNGDLGFSVENPIETIVSYESEHIQKVYWTDGKNQPRLINISPIIDNEGHVSERTYSGNTAFDFVPTLKLKEKVKVKKILGGGGMFAPGVIQYAFTYYNKYGQESNIFYTTPLYYISYADRGASPEDKVDNTFKITVNKVDPNFDYLRIYSIQRTSINSTPICKRVQDIAIAGLTNYTASYTDTGYNGDAIDPTELLYKGGSSIIVGTMEQKDNTLFMGDITTPRNDVPDPTYGSTEIRLFTGKRIFYPIQVSTDSYEYSSQLTAYDSDKQENSVPCAGFKFGNKYRCGIQFQDATGKWTDPIFLDDIEIKGSGMQPSADTNVEPVDPSANNMPVRVTVVNDNADAIKIRNQAYFVVGDKAKLAVRLFSGSTNDEIPGDTGGSDNQRTYNDAVIVDGILHDGEHFCSAEDSQSIGMPDNVVLCDERGSTSTLIMQGMRTTESINYVQGRPQEFTLECTSKVEPVPPPTPTPENFETLLAEFNTVLNSLDITQVSSRDTRQTYNYLESAYNMAKTEWDKKDNGLFNSNNFPEVYNYRGNNSENEDLAYTAMQAWLMAMCLSEILPSPAGTASTNNQTKFFQKAYELGGGKSVALYGDYTLQGDVNIARLVASAVYAKNRSNYIFSGIDVLRDEFFINEQPAATTIPASSWDDLGYTEDSSGRMTSCGYLINTDLIFPGAPGPFADGYTKAYPMGQDRDLFYDSNPDNTRNWWEYNYKVDVAIDDYLTTNYKLYTENQGTYTLKVPANATEKEINKKVLEAATIPLSTDFMYFGKKRIKHTGTDKWYFDNLSYVGISSIWVTKLFFAETNEAVEDTNNVYDIEGPFSSLQSVMFTSPYSFTANNQTTTLYSKTSYMVHLGEVMGIADNSRFTTMFRDYGRRRPLGGTTYSDGARVYDRQEDSLNGFQSGSLTCLFADTEDQVNKNSSSTYADDFPHDKAKSYPSGHSAQAWALALYLGQMKPDSLEEFMRNAYRFSVNRSVGRYHWNSDCIYGRLFGTLVLPILNAMNGTGWRSDYEATKNAVNGGGGGSAYIISVNFTVTNSRSSAVTLDGDICFVLKNPDEDGRYVGWTGIYNRTDHIVLSSSFTLAAGESRTFSGVRYGVTGSDIYDANGNLIGTGDWGLGRRKCLDPSLLSQAQRPRNILVYVGGDSEAVLCDNMDSNVIFVEGSTYTINLTDAIS